MKKSILGTVLLGATILGFSTTAVQAAEVGYQTIDNVAGTDMSNTVSIPTNGTLGTVDNTDPNENIPDGSDRWINVTIPTVVIFNTDADNGHKTVTSPTYKITNNSGRPLQVTYEAFTLKSGDAGSLTSLDFNYKSAGATSDKTFNFVSSGVSQVSGNYVVTLNNVENSATGVDEQNEIVFHYSGTADAQKLANQKTVRLNYSMNMKFKALTNNGEVRD